jgi:NAD(P)-dependent dehydrogenase (short-subunit alcohol dehydrogenase family)
MQITGGSRGIGAATAELAASRGWSVGLVYSSPASEAAAAAVAERCRAAGAPDAVALRADVAIEADVLEAFDAIDGRWGGLDCLVNNAGIAPGYGPFEKLTAADMERTWAVNLTGAFVCAREGVKLMTRDGGGSIVNVGSKAGVLGGPNEWIHYAASKGAIDTLTSRLRPMGSRRTGRAHGAGDSDATGR